MFGEAGGERFRVNDNLPLIFAKLRLKRFVKTNRLCCDHVHERTALHSRKQRRDRKSTRLNSSHQIISYAVFCLKKKKKMRYTQQQANKYQIQLTCRHSMYETT